MSSYYYPEFEYSVYSQGRNLINVPLTVKLTCTDVHVKKLTRVFIDKTETIPLIDKTIEQKSDFVLSASKPKPDSSSSSFHISRSSNGAATTIMSKPPTPSKTTTSSYDLASLSQALVGFGVTDCSVILREVEESIESSSPTRGRGFIRVKIWKTLTTETFFISDLLQQILLPDTIKSV